MGDMEGCLVGIYGWTPDGLSERMFGWKFETDPGGGKCKGFLVISGMVRRLGERMEFWSVG